MCPQVPAAATDPRDVAAALIVIGTLLVIGVALSGALLFVRRAARSGREELHRSLGTERPETEGNARLIGVKSRGLGQMRGSGTLALTHAELVFLMWVPRRELRIAREAIESVETGHGLAGKRTRGNLLHVRWRGAEGMDEAAWGVKDLDGWLAALRS